MRPAAFLLALVALAAPAAAQEHRCVEVELSALGRPGHGSMVNPHAAPHGLIRALDALFDLQAHRPFADSLRLTRLEAGSAINVTPRRALARLLISDPGESDPSLLADRLRAVLPPTASLEITDPAPPC